MLYNKNYKIKFKTIKVEGRNNIVKETLEFLKDCGTFYLATDENGQPRVRPFGAVCEFENKIYIVTNNQKPVYNQMMSNPKVEMSGMDKGKWIRVKCEVELDERREARVAMLEANPSLSRMYNADDNLMVVFKLNNVTSTICSFTEEPQVHTF